MDLKNLIYTCKLTNYYWNMYIHTQAIMHEYQTENDQGSEKKLLQA